MKYFDWDPKKNERLKKERSISFEEVLVAIEGDGLIDIMKNPNQNRYPGQKMFIVKIREYAHLVPYVEDDKKVFLKTIIPSRNATKKYLKNTQL